MKTHARSKTKEYIIHQPYKNTMQFLQSYKPISQHQQFKRVKDQYKQIFYVHDKHGYYYGQILGNQRHGFGVLFHIDGTVYQGLWNNGHKNNNGFQKYTDGSFYEGGFVNGLKQGKGKLVFINGDCFQGEWTKGEKHGAGVWKTKKGQYYIGEWRKNRMEGYGIMNQSNGDKYEGMIKNGIKNGKGIIKYQNGDIFKGFFSQGELNGYGQYFYKNGNSYKGQFKNGNKQGPGQLKQKCPKDKTYQGYFRQNMKWGYGVVTWDSGSCYKGFFERDKRHGYGEMFWPDGNIYRGWWKEGLQHGKGELFIQKQGLMQGIFNNNHLVVLISEKNITRQQYEKERTQGLLPKQFDKNRKHKLKNINNKNRADKTRRKKSKIKTLQFIQFPLLFHKHSRLKTENIQRNHLTFSKIQNKTQTRKRLLTVDHQDNTIAGKNYRYLHSAMSIHKNFNKSNKLQDSTAPSYNNSYKNGNPFTLK